MMFISDYIHNIEEGVRFCRRYGITCSIADGKLAVTAPPESFHKQFSVMTEIAGKIDHFSADHPNCFLSDRGYLIVTFSNYDGELTDSDRKKLRRKGFDIRESGYDLYGFGTTTYVMAALVSPLDEEYSDSYRGECTDVNKDADDEYSFVLSLNKEYFLNELHRILYMFGEDFISYRDTNNVTDEMERLADYLELMYQRKPEEAVETVDEMVDILRNVDTDDDTFPEEIILDLYCAVGRDPTMKEIYDLLNR